MRPVDPVRALALAALAGGLLASLPLLVGPWHPDEGIFAVVSRGWLEGDLPYRDRFDQKPPSLFVVGALTLAGTGDSPLALRAATWLANAAICVLLYLWTRPRLGESRALLAAGIYAIALPLYEGWLFHTEPFLALFLLGSAILFLRSARAPALAAREMLGAGLAFGVAFTFKQPALAALPALAGAYLLARGRDLRSARGWGRLAADAGLFTLAAAAPASLFVAYFWAMGAVDWLVFGAWTVNFAHYPPEGFGRFVAVRFGVSRGPLVLGPALLGVAFAAARPRAGEDAFWLRTVALLFLAGLLPLYYHAYLHYFVQALPFAAVLAAVALARAVEAAARLRPARAPWARAGAALLAGALLLPHSLGAAAQETRNLPERNLWSPAGVAAHVRERTDPGDLVLFYPNVNDVAFFAERSGLGNNVAYVWPGVLYDPDDLLREIKAGRFKYAVITASWIGEVASLYRDDPVAWHVLGNYPRETFTAEWVVYRLRGP